MSSPPSKLNAPSITPVVQVGPFNRAPGLFRAESDAVPPLPSLNSQCEMRPSTVTVIDTVAKLESTRPSLDLVREGVRAVPAWLRRVDVDRVRRLCQRTVTRIAHDGVGERVVLGICCGKRDALGSLLLCQHGLPLRHRSRIDVLMVSLPDFFGGQGTIVEGESID